MPRGKKGFVFLVGAGPGDPKLITLKGYEALGKADVVLYDFLAAKALLRFAKKGAKRICVGKEDGMHLKEQDEINALLVAHASAGKVVVRLKGGDSMLFSRGIDEALFLRAAGISFEIIPGVTSAFAAPASAGIPLTRRGTHASVAVLTGRKSSGEALDAPDCATLVYHMAVSNIAEVVKTILATGRATDTPCAFIERATTKAQRVIAGTLADIVQKAKKAHVISPAVFVVGETVRCGALVKPELWL
jgi:uroporphyrinogen III methyltransferase/synthase